MVWNLFTFKGVLVLGKARSHRAPNLGCRGSWVTWVIWYFAKNPCTRCDTWASTLSWWNCQSPVALSCSLLNPLNSFHGGMFKLNTKLDADSLLYSLSHFECAATQYTCSLNSTYHAPWLVQWSRHCSHMHIPVHSPWLPGYIGVSQTTLIILTMVGLFVDRL